MNSLMLDYLTIYQSGLIQWPTIQYHLCIIFKIFLYFEIPNSHSMPVSPFLSSHTSFPNIKNSERHVDNGKQPRKTWWGYLLPSGAVWKKLRIFTEETDQQTRHTPYANDEGTRWNAAPLHWLVAFATKILSGINNKFAISSMKTVPVTFSDDRRKHLKLTDLAKQLTDKHPGKQP